MVFCGDTPLHVLFVEMCVCVSMCVFSVYVPTAVAAAAKTMQSYIKPAETKSRVSAAAVLSSNKPTVTQHSELYLICKIL